MALAHGEAVETQLLGEHRAVDHFVQPICGTLLLTRYGVRMVRNQCQQQKLQCSSSTSGWLLVVTPTTPPSPGAADAQLMLLNTNRVLGSFIPVWDSRPDMTARQCRTAVRRAFAARPPCCCRCPAGAMARGPLCCRRPADGPRASQQQSSDDD